MNWKRIGCSPKNIRDMYPKGTYLWVQPGAAFLEGMGVELRVRELPVPHWRDSAIMKSLLIKLQRLVLSSYKFVDFSLFCLWVQVQNLSFHLVIAFYRIGPG